MTYPVLDFESLKKRCILDIEKFDYTLYKEKKIFAVPYLLTKKSHPVKDVITITDCQNSMNIIKRNIEIIIKKDLTSFDYSHQISSFQSDLQNRLWRLRTQLFYQLAVIATKMMMDKKLFDDVYKYSACRPQFHETISSELKNYKLGIFGSLTPTSDIDVGIQYSGDTIDNGLAYIISIIEDIFLIFTGIDSLHFDIELYADMMTITDKKDDDIFYLDTTHFEQQHFERLIPYMETSILRNYVFSQSEMGIKEAISSFQYSDFFGTLKNKLGIDVIDSEHLFTKLSDKCIQLVEDYMLSSYDEARRKYYEKVNIAEMEVNKIRKSYKETESLNLTEDKIVEIMSKIAEALTYRAESYTCAPTVMHVVRVLQSNPDKLKERKYDVDYPQYCVVESKPKKAFCNIGKYGYYISIFEQYGYMYRFYLTYCQGSHENKAKCDKKLKKYTDRVLNAMEIVKKFKGGKRRSRRKQTKKHKFKKSMKNR